MGGFFSSPESNSSVQVEEMGASGSKLGLAANTNGAKAPYIPRTNNVEIGLKNRVNTNASDPGIPGSNNTRRNANRNKNRNTNVNTPRNTVAINVNRLQEVVVEAPPPGNPVPQKEGETMAGGRRHRKGSRKSSRRQGHKSRRH